MKGCVLLAFLFVLQADQVARCSDASSNITSDGSHHRVRRFLFTQNSQVSFDLELMIPIPMLGSIDVMAVIGIPLTVTMQNDTFVWNPIQIPYVVMPAPEPIPFPPLMPQYPPYFPPDQNYLPQQPQYQQPQQQYQQQAQYQQPPQYQQPQQQYPSEQQAYPNAVHRSGLIQRPQDMSAYFHHQMKRSTAAAAAQHRLDLFSSLANSLSEFGIDGKACICKSICQLSSAPLLIETPFHEVIEHILTISRSFDEDLILSEFHDAEKIGRSRGNCTEEYEGCGFSLFTLEEH